MGREGTRLVQLMNGRGEGGDGGGGSQRLGGGSAEMGRAQALVSVAQERRAETPLANGPGTVVMDDVAEEGREGEREKGLELRSGRR